MKPLLKRYSLGLVAVLSFAAFGVLNSLKWLQFALGLSTMPDDFASGSAALSAITTWAFSLPWWAPALAMLIPLGVLVHLVLKSAQDFTIALDYRNQASEAAEFVRATRRLNILRDTLKAVRRDAAGIEALWRQSGINEATPIETPHDPPRAAMFNGRREREFDERWRGHLHRLRTALRSIASPSEERLREEQFAARYATERGHEKRAAQYDVMADELRDAMKRLSLEIPSLEKVTGAKLGIKVMPTIAKRLK